MSKYVNVEESMNFSTLVDWYINSVSNCDTPVWTSEHIKELLNDFYVVPKDTPIIDTQDRSGEIE